MNKEQAEKKFPSYFEKFEIISYATLEFDIINVHIAPKVLKMK